MTIALVDDDPILLASLREMLAASLAELGVEVRCIDPYASGTLFFSTWSPRMYDIILLDIYMGEEHGVDIARRIRETDTDALLIFCTSSNEYAAESYEVDASYYLQKPVTEDKLTAMLRRLNLSRIERGRAVTLPDGHRCPLRNILYTEYINHSVTFHLKDTEPHSVYMNHSEAEALLLRYRAFCGVNKGCIVNLAGVKKLDGNAFLMENGESLPIARRRFKEVSDAYTHYRFNRLSEEVDNG